MLFGSAMYGRVSRRLGESPTDSSITLLLRLFRLHACSAVPNPYLEQTLRCVRLPLLPMIGSSVVEQRLARRQISVRGSSFFLERAGGAGERMR